MRKEPHTTRHGYKIWLNEEEQAQLVQHLEEEPTKQLAIEIMLCGLRSDEVTRVSASHLRKIKHGEKEGYKLHIPKGKTGARETPIKADTAKRLRMLKNATGIKKEQPLIQVTPRTVQRWTTTAAAEMAKETGDEDWKHLTAHDLRRTWATQVYYTISGSRAKEIVMSWGGWSDEETFRNSYLGRETDDISLKFMAEAGLL